MELCIEACCMQIMHLIPFQTDESCCTIFFMVFHQLNNFTIEITVKWGESSLLKMIDKPTVDDSSGDELGEWGEGGGRRGGGEEGRRCELEQPG